MITRRMFHTRLLAALAATALPFGPAARAAVADMDRLWLNRLTFGATPAALAEMAALGRIEWLEEQFRLPSTDAPLVTRLGEAKLRIYYEAGEDEDGNSWPALDELRPLSLLLAGPDSLMRLADWGPGKGMDYSERARPAQEVIAASLIRATHGQAQLREMMTQFWHDHFNVNSSKDETTAIYFSGYDGILRTQAFGNFRSLLGAVARSPSMLFYLDNVDSIASPANENFARELLELHTLGAGNYLAGRYSDWKDVPGALDGLAEGYLDLDVLEVARAFTGWSVGDGRWLDEGVSAPRTGRFNYVDRWHDPYQKRFLGREFPPNRGPMEDGDEVLDMLAAHPGTARFLCTKIARRFLADDPPEALVEKMAAEFLAAVDAPDQIARTLRVLILSREFESPPAKIRRPFEFLAGLCRGAGADIDAPEIAWNWYLPKAGWRQHEFGPPNGHPDRIEAWTGASALNRLVDLALDALDPRTFIVKVDLARLAEPAETVQAFFVRHASALAPEAAAGIAAELALAFEVDPGSPAGDYGTDFLSDAGVAALAFAALTPEFLLR
jgi:uncharacterized protein (DUF1800 family)